MSWFHKHRLKLVATTYAPPLLVADVHGPAEAVERAAHGCTSFVWACEDAACDHRVVIVVLGKVQP
jgi:hypothetical protein